MPRDPGQLVPHHDGSVDCDRAGRRLGDGHQIQHFVFSDPMVFIHEFLLHQRNDDITAPERECTQIQCGQEYFPQYFPWDSFSSLLSMLLFSILLTVSSRILVVLSVNCKTAPHFSMLPHTQQYLGVTEKHRWSPDQRYQPQCPASHSLYKIPREIPQRHYSEQCRRSQPDMIILAHIFFSFYKALIEQKQQTAKQQNSHSGVSVPIKISTEQTADTVSLLHDAGIFQSALRKGPVE